VGNANRRCRHCTARFEDIQTKHDEDEFVLHNLSLHDKRLQQLDENPELYSHYSKKYGVTRKTVLLDAPYFDVTQQFPEDIMHVILKGALSRALYFVILYFINNDIFSLNDLNAYMLNFNYGYSELKDK